MKYKTLIIAVACTALTGGVTSTPLQAADKPAVDKSARDSKHPGMHRALEGLLQAQETLATAARDFGGHRKAAKQQTDGAIKEVEAALRVENDLPERLTRPTPSGPKDQDTEAAQKQMREARRALLAAQREVEEAGEGFQGHRAKALALIEEALKSVDKGMAASK